MAEFVARSRLLRGSLTVAEPVERAFPLFSPLGEKEWVPDSMWQPELLHPPGVSWERGLLFRTPEESGEAIWIVTVLDRKDHRVEYHRVEPGHFVARIHVTCTAAVAGTTVQVSYEYVGLSDAGNEAIGAFTEESFRERMRSWEQWIRQR